MPGIYRGWPLTRQASDLLCYLSGHSRLSFYPVLLFRTLGLRSKWCECVKMCVGENRDGIHLGHSGLIQISLNLVKSINSVFISNW